MTGRRVVVTGIGTINPLGNSIEEYFSNLEKGVSGAAPITHFDAEKFKTKFACEVKNYDPTQYFDRKEVRKYDLFTQYALIAATQAVEDSALDLEKVDKEQVGVIWSSGIGGIKSFFDECLGWAAGDGTPRFSPFFIPRMISDIAAGFISMKYGFIGPNYCTVSACASSNHGITAAFDAIRYGKADVMVAGGSEAAVNEPSVGGFNSMQALSTRNDDPQHASRPFDKDRDGFVIGEGAGALILEEYEHAKARAKANGTELPTPPEAGIDAKLEMLMTECDGHAETEDAEILHARKRFEELCEEFAPEVKREAEVVREAGGLFIIGTERHESRRIDNQLRGRAGRQGDPGASRFFLSLEDDLMRIFGGERVQNLMDSLGLDEDVPIENKLITNTIESAQKKLEASNFAIRKQVLQYDDVMNQQREIIYKQRQMVLDGEDISGKLHEMMRQSIDDACANYLNGETADDWDFAGLRRHFMNWLCLPTDFNYTTEQLGELTREGIADELYKRGMDILTAKEKRYGEKTMRELERICLLRNVDSKWMEHIDNMDQLKQGMGLRGYGQHDPVVEYRIEGFAMFDEMIASIREDAVHMLLTIEIRQQNAEPKREQVAKPTGEGAPAQAGAKGTAPVRVTKIGRNDPCPCGSGLKWKKCTCKEYHPDL